MPFFSYYDLLISWIPCCVYALFVATNCLLDFVSQYKAVLRKTCVSDLLGMEDNQVPLTPLDCCKYICPYAPLMCVLCV